MRALLLPLVLLPLLGCTVAPAGSRQANCQALVNSDPEIRDLTMKYPGAFSPKDAGTFDPTPLRREKMKACMQGYPVNGGVERVKSPNYTFDLF